MDASAPNGHAKQIDTKTRILDVAERFFGERGYGGTSLRAITTAARVHVGSVNYHFGSKHGLLKAVMERRIVPVNRERLNRLDQLEASADGAAALDDIVDAFFIPLFLFYQDTSRSGPYGLQLFARILTEPKPEIISGILGRYEEIARRFTTALIRALPHLAAEEVFWRYQFMVGSIFYGSARTGWIERISDGRCSSRDIQQMMQQMRIGFDAMFRAPSCLPIADTPAPTRSQ